MSEEFGPDFLTVTDEDGNELVLEYVDTLEHNGLTYTALDVYKRQALRRYHCTAAEKSCATPVPRS